MIRLEQVSKSYRVGGSAVWALRDISLTIEAGEYLAIMGASGSGKSTLLHVLGLLDRPDAGVYFLGGRPVSALREDELAVLRNRMVGFVFQQFFLLPRITALENVALPRLYSFDHSDRGRAAELLREVGLGDRLRHRPNQLSGGQQQRVAIARALMNDPEMILADEPTGNLDSASAAEIIAILGELHRRGKTIILATHEPDLAAQALRVVRLRDGRVVADERRGGTPPVRASSPREVGFPSWKARLRASARRSPALVREALRAVAAGKMRSLLSVLGILIGVAAVIAMVALGTGARRAIAEQLRGLGSNALMIRSGARRAMGVTLSEGAVARLTLEDAAELREAVPAIARVAPMVVGAARAVFGNRNWSTQVVGTTPDYAPMRASAPQVGRFFTEEEVRRRARVAVIGMTPYRELFRAGSPIGATIRLNRVGFQVIGVLPEKGGGFGPRNQDDQILIPITTAMYRLLGRKHVDVMNVEIRETGQIQPAKDAIAALLRRRHRVAPENEDAFEIRDLTEIQQALSSTSRTMSLLLAAIAVISLVVGGIGIMNIMLVSVTERTREIGLRKAVGAWRREILAQFLTEAVVISVTGGLLGIVLGGVVARAMARLAGWPVAVTPWAVLLAFGFSASVGVVFGMWPARRASVLNPIDALRYE